MRLTVRALNRATLARQLLLARAPLGVEDALRRVVVLQAQEPASPYLALWNRVDGFAAADLDAAVTGYRAVKSTLVRITLHLVHADHYGAVRTAMEPSLRGARLRDARFTRSGLTPEDADALLPDLLAFAEQPRTTAEFAAWLEARAGFPLDPTAWRMLRQYSPLWHAPGAAPWSYVTRPAFVAARPRPVLGGQEAADAALVTLVRRYLAGFGPASVADAAQFALVQRSRARAAMKALADEVEEFEGPDGTVLYDLPGAPRPDEDVPAPPRLMAMWDSVLLAHADRTRVLPAAYRKHVTRVNGDVLPTLLVDGEVAGVWRVVDGRVEAGAFQPLPERAWAGLAEEAARLVAFLADREPGVYGRYGHWWDKGIPVTESRVLGA
ncbi:winged helix DNA-binding domain-containing protein [Streptomyces sp. NPDC001941]|uniref:winged helix DNA-binding domain-containing protein n=1 Tax=Streptomyces sp. NPDC001941 TaxID=3154659 RepID=UPI003326E19B